MNNVTALHVAVDNNLEFKIRKEGSYLQKNKRGQAPATPSLIQTSSGLSARDVLAVIIAIVKINLKEYKE